MHQAIFADTFEYRNPIILYNDHADFQQTNTIGRHDRGRDRCVTEALKNRVVIPLTMSKQQTTTSWARTGARLSVPPHPGGDSTSLESLGNLPSGWWKAWRNIMSIGRQDAHNLPVDARCGTERRHSFH